jgi:hypothetical protein
VNSSGAEGDSVSTFATLSADGRLMSYASWSGNLVTSDTNGHGDVFVHDRWDGLGQNSIYLTGPTTALVGAPVEFNWQTTRGGSHFWLAYSQNLNGSVISGHNFDLGTPMQLLASGKNSMNGTGGFTSAAIPPRAAGHTIYFEAAARDDRGMLYDSNVLAVTFQ